MVEKGTITKSPYVFSAFVRKYLNFEVSYNYNIFIQNFLRGPMRGYCNIGIS